jgi:branched-chain amino acid transport system permease protein
VRGRPLLFTSYEDDQALLNSTTKKVVLMFALAVSVVIPFDLMPGLAFLASDDWLKVLSRVFIFAIGALGLNILTGLAGQVSLGHAFFMGIGAYTAAGLGAAPGALWGLGLPMWIWLPAAGLVAALLGVLIAPTAVRVRGVYLGIVTLGLVFIGDHVFRNIRSMSGGSQSGRSFPPFQLRLWKEESPLVDFSTDGPWLGVDLSAEAKTYFLLLALAIVFTLVAKNLQRTRVGRAFQAIRDRDVAAEVMGVDEFRYKTLAFAVSSFFAGVAGALLASFVGRLIPEGWDLALSVQFIAIILIGGAGTVSGTWMGSAFVVVLPRTVQDLTNLMSQQVEKGEGLFARLADVVVSTAGGDFGLVNTLPGSGPGLSVFQLNLVIYGLLIIGFLIFEPLGLFGIWLRIRNYWRGWPFTY